MKGTVRIKSIELENFANIEFGKIETTNTHMDFPASIVAIYGQNGSGKTAVISSLGVLQHILRREPLEKNVSQFIKFGCPYFRLAFCFCISNIEGIDFDVVYEFKIRKAENLSEYNSEQQNVEQLHPYIDDEILSCSFSPNGKKRRTYKLVDTTGTELIGPKVRLNSYTKGIPKASSTIFVGRKLSQERAVSFIFSRDFFELIKKQKNNEESIHYCSIFLERLYYYGSREFFVVDAQNAGRLALDVLPLDIHYTSHTRILDRILPLKFADISRIPLEYKVAVKNIVNSINIPLKEIIPGLTIDIKEIQRLCLSNNIDKIAIDIEFIAKHDTIELALRQESEGTKRIISILYLLIFVYNQPEVTVAINELDAGIFEYLFGNLLEIITNHGKGQLIFTSHNLRPLETIDNGFIVFTTTNSKNRYIRINNAGKIRNLRDDYFRSLTIGADRDQLYTQVNNSKLLLAFNKAWKNHIEA